MEKIKQKDLAQWRKATWEAQGKKCALTGYTISLAEAVVDHCHKTGEIRGVIHRGVNSLLGKCENNYRRYGLSWPMTKAFLEGAGDYVDKPGHGVMYPTHKTTEEKRIIRNARARAARARKKAEQKVSD